MLLNSQAKRGFTLVELMMVICIIGMLLAIAVPSFLQQRTRSQVTSCQENLRVIQAAKQRWAMENNKGATSTPTWDDLSPMFIKGKKPSCPAGGTYTIGSLDADPTCSVGGEHSIR